MTKLLPTIGTIAVVGAIAFESFENGRHLGDQTAFSDFGTGIGVALTSASSLSVTDAYALKLVPDMVSGGDIVAVNPNADRRAQRAIVTVTSSGAAVGHMFPDLFRVRRT